uniref:Uncharacterized protein n=1 Tax=Anguilla anguilla TaxID=7936 RepID=A0A0E9X3P3_ANGAN
MHQPGTRHMTKTTAKIHYGHGVTVYQHRGMLTVSTQVPVILNTPILYICGGLPESRSTRRTSLNASYDHS